MKKFLASFAFLVLIIFSAAYEMYQLSKSRTFQFFGGLTNRVQTNEKVVALTFDDAPSQFSNQVVDVLSEHNTPATFYVIGQNLEKFPDEAKYIADHGHELGNHSFSHHRFILKSLSFIDREIHTTNQLIQNAGYQGEITFRPPGGKKLLFLPWYLNQHGIKTIMWDVEPDTYVHGDSQAIVDYTLENTHSGSIILLHPFCPANCAADRDALPLIITGLKSQGYTFVTISQLLQYQ